MVKGVAIYFFKAENYLRLYYMSTTLNQRKKRGGAVWTEEFYTKGKKKGQKVPGFGLSKAQFTKEGVARKARKTRSKIGEVDKDAKEKEMAQRLGWTGEDVEVNMRSVGHIDRGAHLQFKHVSSNLSDAREQSYQGQDGGFQKIEDLGLTKRGKIRVQATGHRRVGKGSKGKKSLFNTPHPDDPLNNQGEYTEQSSGLLEALHGFPDFPPENHNPLLASLNIPQNVAPTPKSVSVAPAPVKKKKKFKIKKKATPTPKPKPAIAPKPKVKKVMVKTKKDGKTTFKKKYKVGNTLF